eukprot:6114865-Alexandrium_andersonii.AAC.1
MLADWVARLPQAEQAAATDATGVQTPDGSVTMVAVTTCASSRFLSISRKPCPTDPTDGATADRQNGERGGMAQLLPAFDADPVDLRDALPAS